MSYVNGHKNRVAGLVRERQRPLQQSLLSVRWNLRNLVCRRLGFCDSPCHASSGASLWRGAYLDDIADANDFWKRNELGVFSIAAPRTVPTCLADNKRAQMSGSRRAYLAGLFTTNGTPSNARKSRALVASENC